MLYKTSVLQSVSKRAGGVAEFPLWQRTALFSLAYLLCAEAGIFLSAQGGTLVSFWLPAGLYVSVLLLNSSRDWPWLSLGALAANFIFDFFHGTKFLPALGFYFANTAQAVLGAWLVRRFVAEKPSLATLKEIAGLMIFSGILSSMFGALIGAGTLVHFGLSGSFANSWKVWWGSNALAILLFAPFLLAWFSRPSVKFNYLDSPRKKAELLALIFGLIVFLLHLLVWEKGIMSADRALAVPLLLWAGLRFGPCFATTASLFLALPIAYFTTQHFTGLSPEQIATGSYVFGLQIFLAMANFVALLPAVVLDERNRTMIHLRDSENRFRSLNGAAFEGVSISENGVILDMNDQGLKMFGYGRAEMIGKPIIELVAPESRATVAAAVHLGREATYEHQLLRRDGSIFFAEARARMVQAGARTLRTTALRDITERKRAESERQQAVEREQQSHIEYTLQLIASQEAERKRIAAELHDSIGQNLLLIKNLAQLAARSQEPAQIYDHAVTINNLATQCIAEVRQISRDLHPYQLDHLGLKRALAAMLENIAQASAFQFNWKLDDVDEIISGDPAMNLYRIVQESLSNILKHSGAAHVRLELERDIHEVQLRIEDDGCGFKPGALADHRKGMGLRNITERVRMLGGKLTVDSAPGQGTRIAVTIPIVEKPG